MRSAMMAVVALTALAPLGARAGVATGGPPRPVEAALREAAEASARKAPPAMVEVGRQGIEEVAASGILQAALNVGATCPAFTLGDARGDRVSSAALLAKGPVVIVFYRGAWCPYCNLYLHAWQGYLPRLAERSATLVAISGEPPDRTAAVAKKTEATFTVLSDPGYRVSRQFGVVYEVPKGVADLMLGWGMDMKGYYGTGKAELPLSATYVVGQDGKIVYAFLDADYKKRAEPADVLAVLDRLAPTKR